jgi:hypothetical protein
MQKWSWVGSAAKGGDRKEFKRRIEDELHRFERFQLADQVSVAEPAALHAVGSTNGLMEATMDNGKAILTAKDIATTAADAASYALSKEQPPLKAEDSAAAYIPLAADGLVSDPLMQSVAVAPARRKRSAAREGRGKKVAKKAVKKAGSKSRAAKSGKPAVAKSKRAPKKATSAKATRRMP